MDFLPALSTVRETEVRVWHFSSNRIARACYGIRSARNRNDFGSKVQYRGEPDGVPTVVLAASLVAPEAEALAPVAAAAQAADFPVGWATAGSELPGFFSGSPE